MSRIEKMFIIEFVVKIIIKESDIGIAKKRVYMLHMLRSLLSMFNLFEDGITHAEKNSFEKLLDMLTQLLLFLKTEFCQNTDVFLETWKAKGLFEEAKDGLHLSASVASKLKSSSLERKDEHSKEEFLAHVRKMLDADKTGGAPGAGKMKTRVICESEMGLKKLNQKRKSLLLTEGVFGSELEKIVSDQFIAKETFDNECRVVFNLILQNSQSRIILKNFQKLLYLLLKMEELTVLGVLTSFRMRRVLERAKEKKASRVFSKINRAQKSRITRFTNLSIPDFFGDSLFKQKGSYSAQDVFAEDLPDEALLEQKKLPNVADEGLDAQAGRGFPEWLLSSLEIVRHSRSEGLVYRALEFLYSMLDWDKASLFTLSVRYNNLLYKDAQNFSESGVFWGVLVKLFDLMEISAYKKVALSYFMSFVMENCEFVIGFIRAKLARATARDFRQIASLWKNTFQQNSSTVRKLLGETVFDMLNYADAEDPLVRNYFKNWLQHSQKNFYLILNRLLKKLYLQTNMKLQAGRVVYNFLFRTEQFAHLLRLLRSVFTSGGNSFLNFIRKTRISDEFEVYSAEMDAILDSFFRDDSKKYYSFLLKLLLCYLLADPSAELNSEFLPQSTTPMRPRTLSAKAETIYGKPLDLNKESLEETGITLSEHTRRTDAMKESICLFIEQLFQSLNNDEDFHVALTAQKMLRPVSFNLDRAIQSNRITLQLEYLNLLSFLVFKTKFAKALGPLNIQQRLVTAGDRAKIEHFGEGFKELGFPDEKESGRKSKMEKKKGRKSKRKSKAGAQGETAGVQATESLGLKLLENLKTILAKTDFLKTLLKGLNNEHTFVMTKYLEYINKLLFMYTKLFSENTLQDALKSILFTYLSIIHENGVSKGPLQDQEKRKEKVISLLKGMRFFLEQVLQFEHVEIKNERGVEKALVAIFTLGIVSQKEQSRTKMVFKLEESTCMDLINHFTELFSKLMETYRPTGLVADPDVYRMLQDPNFLTAQAEPHEQDLYSSNVNIKQSINESVLAGNIFETNSIYKSTNMFSTQEVHREDDFGVLASAEFSGVNLTSVSRHVFKILNPLCNNFVMKSIEAVLANWAACNQQSLGLSGLDLLDLTSKSLRRLQNEQHSNRELRRGGAYSDLHIRLLELLLYSDIEPERLLKGVDFSMQMKKIKEYRKAFSSKFSSKIVYCWTAHAQREIHLLSFLFAYIKYCCRPQNFFDSAKGKYDSARMASFSTTLLSLLKVFEGPENVLSYAWVLDVISVFLQKFEGVSGFAGKTRSDWRSFISDLWGRIGKIVSGDYSFEFPESNEAPGVLVPLRPINPSLRSVSGSLKLQLAKHFRGNQEEKEKMFDYRKFHAPETNTMRYQYFLLVTLKKSLYQVCDFFLSSSKGGSSRSVSPNSSLILQRSADPLQVSALVEDSSVWNLVRLRPLVDKLLGMVKSRREHSLLHQEISEILLVLCTNRSFLAEFKQNLLDIFDSDHFFRCDVKTLKMWSRIIDRVLDFSKNSAIVDYYMKNIDFKGVFVFRNTENRKRMKCFLRICFIIYSGDAEKYIDKRALKTLLEKIKNLLKEEDSDPRLTILILFSLRILIMRLQQSTLNELFRTIWPSIIFLLRRLIKSKSEQNDGIFLASMKLLELISSTDIEEFNLHKWSFMFEYFGVELNMIDRKRDSSRLLSSGCYESKPLCIQGPRGEELVGFHVHPFLMAQMPADTLVQFKLRSTGEVNTYSSKLKLTAAYNNAEVIKRRKVVITENILEDIKLEHKIHQFLTYSVQSSRMDIQIDKEDLECVIEKDFIDFGVFFL